MRKISACGFIFFVMLFFSSCAVSKPNGTVKLSVASPEGTPIPDVYVYAEKYADGREIFPGPLLGVTDKNGILEYTPEQYGAQEANLFAIRIHFGRERAKNGGIRCALWNCFRRNYT